MVARGEDCPDTEVTIALALIQGGMQEVAGQALAVLGGSTTEFLELIPPEHNTQEELR
jgi:hypothetical protein